MSRRLQDLFWDIDLSGTEQVVAQRLAWHASDEDGRCWPGIRSLATKTGLSERAVQNATKALEAAGHISRTERIGQGMVYTVHPRTTCTPREAVGTLPDDLPAPATPAADAPPCPDQAMPTPAGGAPRTGCTPAADAPDPRTTCTQTVQEPINTNIGSASASLGRMTGQRGRRIDADWQPTMPLPDKLAKVVDGWPPGRLGDLRDEFVSYWLAAAGKTASKLDWDQTFHNRIRAVIARDAERETSRDGQRYRHDRPSAWSARPGFAGLEPASLDD